MPKILLALSLALLSISAQSATVYISDAFTVPMRRGPSNGHKILHAGLPSGTALEESRVLGFENEVVVLGWGQSLDDLLPLGIRLPAAVHQLGTIGAPTSMIVVHIDDWNAAATSPHRQAGDWFSNSTRNGSEPPAVFEVEIRDKIDD